MNNNTIVELSERIANLALDTFDALPARCKPRNLLNGQTEWTPMAAVILSRPPPSLDNKSSSLNEAAVTEPLEIKIVSLATGTKSLPVSALAKCKGLVLHDCHAETLALRGFNFWSLCEIERLLTRDEYESQWMELSAHILDHDEKRPPFKLRKGVEISLFCTEAPCGDASMELLMASTLAAGGDATPWPIDVRADMGTKESTEATPNLPLGRGQFSQLGALRRKPARADAEISMSKSCTDKIMMKQFTSALAFPADLFIGRSEEAFLKRMVVYEDQFDACGYQRAFSMDGRLVRALPLLSDQDFGSLTFFDVERLWQSFRRFPFERSRGSSPNAGKSKVTNVSSIWIAGEKDQEGSEVVEVLINGVKQGYKQFAEKQGKGSVLCRWKMAQKMDDIRKLLHTRGCFVSWLDDEHRPQYCNLKSLSCRSQMKEVKKLVLEALGGWPSKPDDDFDTPIESFANQSETYPKYSGGLLAIILLVACHLSRSVLLRCFYRRLWCC